MLRQLLTLLAVLSGLTATVTPAHALETGVQAVELAQDGASCIAKAAVHSEDWNEVFTRITDDRQNFCPRPIITISTPTVMLRVDRAHE